MKTKKRLFRFQIQYLALDSGLDGFMYIKAIDIDEAALKFDEMHPDYIIIDISCI